VKFFQESGIEVDAIIVDMNSVNRNLDLGDATKLVIHDIIHIDWHFLEFLKMFNVSNQFGVTLCSAFVVSQAYMNKLFTLNDDAIDASFSAYADILIVNCSDETKKSLAVSIFINFLDVLGCFKTFFRKQLMSKRS